MSERLMEALFTTPSIKTLTKYKEKKKKRKLEERLQLEDQMKIEEKSEELSYSSPIFNINKNNENECENLKLREKKEILNVSKALNTLVDSHIDSSRRGRFSSVHSKSENEFYEILCKELSRTIITESDSGTDNNNNIINSSYIINPRKFYQNDKEDSREEFGLKFEKYNEIHELGLSQKSLVIANVITNPTIFAQKSNLNNDKILRPSTPKLSPEYRSKYLRPAREFAGERICNRGTLCKSLIVSSKNFSNKQNEFMLREFLLPNDEERFLTTGQLPKDVGMCLVCYEYFVFEVYFILKENDSRIRLHVNDVNKLYPSIVNFKNNIKVPIIQNHCVPTRGNLASDSTKYYPSNSLLEIDPHVGLILPFRKPNFNILHISTVKVIIDSHGNEGFLPCYIEADVQDFR